MAVDLIAQVRVFVRSRLAPGDRLCLGYSGGLDSSALLHVLAGLQGELHFRLSAIHVHHGLSNQADHWVEHCLATCRRLVVPLTVRRVEIVVGKSGLEAAARAARYQAFAEQEADWIVLAHHQDDQAETFLFRLLRGAGVQGLAAMAEAGGVSLPILRPLLSIDRAVLRDYVQANDITYVDDESNFDTGLTRNWLRHAILPRLEQRFPATRVILARTAAQLGESARLLEELAELDLLTAGTLDAIRLDALSRLSPERARNLLRYCLRQQTGLVPSRAWLEEALKQLLEAEPDRVPALRLGRNVLTRQSGCVRLLRQSSKPFSGHWCWQGEAELDLDGFGRLRFSASQGEGLAIRALPAEGALVTWRVGGERMQPDCRRPARTLKNLLREAAVPALARSRLPMLLIDGSLAWVAGIGVDCAFQAQPGEPGWLISWCPPGH